MHSSNQGSSCDSAELLFTYANSAGKGGDEHNADDETGTEWKKSDDGGTEASADVVIVEMKVSERGEKALSL
jgi:hypothetical protein